MNKFTAMSDPSHLDFHQWRVNMLTENGARMLCRCDSEEDAMMIVEALGKNASYVTASRDGEVLREIETALALLKEVKKGASSTNSTDKKLRVTL